MLRRTHRFHVWAVLLIVSLTGSHALGEDEAVFSGPQVGEKLTSFEVTGVYDEAEGKPLDFVARADGRPLMLIFVHQVTRPSHGLVRLMSEYAKRRADDGLQAGVVWLEDDRSKAEQFLKRARGSLRLSAPVGVSVDGSEGPGSYGLNRNVTLTVLVAKDNQVTANFALVQPNETDAPNILAEVCKLIGGQPPTLAQIRQQIRGPAAANMRAPDPEFRAVIRPVIDKTASAEAVSQAAAKVEKYVGDDKDKQSMLGAIARRIVDSGRLENYGTPAAQEHIRRWAEKYGPPAERQRPKPAAERDIDGENAQNRE